MSEPYPPRAESEALDSVAVFRPPPPPRPSPYLRLILWGLFLVFSFAGLGYRLYRLQILEGPGYQALGERNRLRVIPLSAPRGLLLDRQGRPLVWNDPAFRVLVIPGDLPEDPARREAIFRQLSQATNSTNDMNEDTNAIRAPVRDIRSIRDRIEAAAREAPFQPLVLKEPVDREVAFRLMEEGERLPGVRVEPVLQRRYPTGALTAHVVGFIGRIPAEQAARYRAEGYDPATDQVGLSGQLVVDLHYPAGEGGPDVADVPLGLDVGQGPVPLDRRPHLLHLDLPHLPPALDGDRERPDL